MGVIPFRKTARDTRTAIPPDQGLDPAVFFRAMSDGKPVPTFPDIARKQ
jgi:hypothetical protein